MSIDAITYAKTLDVDNPMSRLLLFMIAENTFNDTGVCKVGQGVLQEETRASERTVRDHLKKLADLFKVIKITPRPLPGGGKLNDAIELLGFVEWLRARRGRPAPEPAPDEPANSVGSEPEDVEPANPEPAKKGEPASSEPADRLPVRNKASRTRGPVHSPPTPSPRGSPGKVKSFLPEDWELPDEWREWAKAKAPTRSLWISSEADKFKDYHVGKGTRWADWRRAWQNWWRGACERPQPKGSMAAPVRPLPPDKALRAPVWGDKPDADEVQVYRADTPEFNAYITRLIADGSIAEAGRIQQRGFIKERPSRMAGAVADMVVAKVAALKSEVRV